MKKATSSATSSGSSANLTANSLNEYTNYYYYVTASDGKANPVQGTVQGPIKTYCPGNTYTCEGPFYGTTTCWACGGYGYHSHTWKFDYVYQPTASVTGKCGYGCGGSVNRGTATCSLCGERKRVPTCVNFCKEWVEAAERETYGKCGKCNGSGNITDSIACKHGYTETHPYCIHDHTSQHDD